MSNQGEVVQGGQMNTFLDLIQTSTVIQVSEELIPLLIPFFQQRINLLYMGDSYRGSSLDHISWCQLDQLHSDSWLLLDHTPSDSQWKAISGFKFILFTKGNYSLHTGENVQLIRIRQDIPSIAVNIIHNQMHNQNDFMSIIKEIQEWEPEIDHVELLARNQGTLVKVKMVMEELGFWCSRQIIIDYCKFRVSNFECKNYDLDLDLDNWNRMISPLLQGIAKGEISLNEF